MIYFSHERAITRDGLNEWLIRQPSQDLNGWSLQHLHQSIEQNSYCYFYQQNQIRALVTFQKNQQAPVEILYLATSPQFRRQGLMYELLKALKGYCGQQPIWLECRASNQAALKLYEKLGFRRTGLRKGYYKDGMDAILLNF